MDRGRIRSLALASFVLGLVLGIARGLGGGVGRPVDGPPSRPLTPAENARFAEIATEYYSATNP